MNSVVIFPLLRGQAIIHIKISLEIHQKPGICS